MRTRFSLASFAIFSTVFMAGPLAGQAWAQDADLSDESAPRYRFGAFVGGNYLPPENELGNAYFDDQVPLSGALVGVRGSYRIPAELHEKSALWLELDGKLVFSSTEGGAGGRASESSPVLGWRLNLIDEFDMGSPVTPFVLVGAGGETVLGGSSEFMDVPDTDFTWYLGGGLRYALSEQVDLRGDLRLAFTAARENDVSNPFEAHVGVAWSFGESSKAEPEPEPVPEPVPEPPADQDGDGLVDEADQCPTEAETFNNIDDEDGCPERDEDNDGFLGSQDQCPTEPEDMDKYKDEDGCPDPDNDGDGRPDTIDQCPDTAENLNGYEDDDGCPDTIPEQVKKFTGTIKGIEFKRGSARILSKSKKTLNGALKVMQQYPELRIEISGHTDTQGSAEQNRALSRKRADYVKWYLVDKGIEADRIETVGHGPDRPVADNKTAAGRAQNRRIEFRLLSAGPSADAAVPKDEGDKGENGTLEPGI